jgi:hypothetical protein
MESLQAAGRGIKRRRNSAGLAVAGESVVREFLQIQSLIFLLAASMALGDSQVPAALSGRVTSQPEGAMEGVIVGAKKAGSTINVWVVSDAQGQYAFPPERLELGKYAISVRAVSAAHPPGSATQSRDPPDEACQPTLERRVAHQYARNGAAEASAR